MKNTKDSKPTSFENPTGVPGNPEQANEWQQANRTWWESHPMRYDWKSKIKPEEFSREFYKEIDRRFFRDARSYLPWKKIPFDTIIDFGSLGQKNVLEVGVGNGSHAHLLAQHARSFTGIDITGYAVKSTSERFRCYGIKGSILQMDAEEMKFPDKSFDMVWSWGVIHHSSNTAKALQEIHRVLKPGGLAATMVYHRNFWNYYVMGGVFRGLLMGDILKTRSLHKSVQKHTDGAIARFYTIKEWESLVKPLFQVQKTMIMGSKAEMIPLPAGRVKQAIMSVIPDASSRFFTNRCKMGTFLVSMLKKPSGVQT